MDLNSRLKNSFEYIGLALIAGLIYFSLGNLRSVADSPQSLMFLPPNGIEHYSLGFQDVIADTLWIRALQDFDFCEHKDTEGQCHSGGWLYRNLEITTDLSPHFRIPYAAGALSLSVMVHDKIGAQKLFDRGVLNYPKDWPILYRAGYHYYYEINDSVRAAQLFTEAEKNGGPWWLYELSAKLYTEAGKKEFAEHMYEDLKKNGVSEGILKRVRAKMNL